MTDDDIPHGTLRGGRLHSERKIPWCEPCRQARRRYKKRHYAGRRRLVPAQGVQKHIADLRRSGMTLARIGREIGMSTSQVWHLATRAEKVTVVTARKIYAVRPVPPHLMEGKPRSLVPAHGIRRRLQALQWQHWSAEALEQHFGDRGLSRELVERIRNGERQHVWLSTARAVVAVFDEIGTRQGPSRKPLGGIPASAWDDIDDPRERPKGLLTEQEAS